MNSRPWGYESQFNPKTSPPILINPNKVAGHGLLGHLFVLFAAEKLRNDWWLSMVNDETGGDG